MFQSVNGIIIAVLSLGFLIFIHELGHFLAAKRCGIRVDKFSIGFGPKLIGFTRGETEYCISILPFGGFVKMPGENPEERTGEPGEFSSAPVEHRIFVAIAGPAMNFAFGIIVFSLIYLVSGNYVRSSLETTQIGYVFDESPAAVAGIRPGDRIVSISGHRLQGWQDLNTKILTKPGKELEVEIIRDGQKQTLVVVPETEKIRAREIGRIGVTPKRDAEVYRVMDGSSASTAGIRVGDLIHAINGEPVYSHLDFYVAAKHHHGNDVVLSVKRGYIFAIDLDSENELDDGEIPIALERAFRNNGVHLSSAPVVSTISAGERWMLSDRDKTYVLRADGRKLNIYKHGGEPLEMKLRVNWQFIVAGVQAGSPAENAGVQVGDEFFSVNGESVYKFNTGEELQELMARADPDKPIQLEFRRGDVALGVAVPPVDAGNLLSGWGLTLGESVSGIQLTEPGRVEKYNIITAWGRGIEESWTTVANVFSLLGGLLSFDVSPKLLAGPIGIVTATAETARAGVRGLLYIVAFISINLGIVNLLPIPIADGGQILFFALEKLRGKPLSVRKQMLILQVSVVFIVGLFLYITWYDILGLEPVDRLMRFLGG